MQRLVPMSLYSKPLTYQPLGTVFLLLTELGSHRALLPRLLRITFTTEVILGAVALSRTPFLRDHGAEPYSFSLHRDFSDPQPSCHHEWLNGTVDSPHSFSVFFSVNFRGPRIVLTHRMNIRTGCRRNEVKRKLCGSGTTALVPGSSCTTRSFCLCAEPTSLPVPL